MEASNAKFYKFPKTIHLAGSSVVDDDEVMSQSTLKALMTQLKNVKMIVQEKVDGANVSVHFEQEWQPIIQKRGGIIQSKEKPQYDIFRNWCYEKMEDLYKVIGTEYVLFGEWLWQKHSISYDSLPDYFLAFDVLEKKTGKFLCNKSVHALLKDTVHIVPNLYDGELKLDIESLVSSLVGKSKFGSDVAEGVYIRFEDDKYVIDRCKYRRNTFVAGRADFNTKIENNSLKQ